MADIDNAFRRMTEETLGMVGRRPRAPGSAPSGDAKTTTGELTSTAKAERYIENLLAKDGRTPRAVARAANASPLTLDTMRGNRTISQDTARRVVEVLGGDWAQYLQLIEGRPRP